MDGREGQTRSCLPLPDNILSEQGRSLTLAHSDQSEVPLVRVRRKVREVRRRSGGGGTTAAVLLPVLLLATLPPPQPVDVRPGQSSVLVRRVGRPRPRTSIEGRRSGRYERRVSPEGVGVGRLAGVLDDVPHPDGLSVFAEQRPAAAFLGGGGGKEGGGGRVQSRSETEVLRVLFLLQVREAGEYICASHRAESGGWAGGSLFGEVNGACEIKKTTND